MVYPYDSGLDPDDPVQLMRQRNAARRSAQAQQPQLPNISPEAEEDLLSRIGSSLMGGVGWLGQTLDKPGRALRGLLVGKPSELLNLIPFSDTMNITSPTTRVSGRELLGLGEGTKGEFEATDLLGFGAEVLTDPLMMLSPFAKTPAGLLAAKHSALPKTWAGRMAGFATEAEIPAAMRSAAEAAGVPIVSQEAARLAGTTATPLGSLMGAGLPFGKNLAFMGTGPTAQKVAAALDAGWDWMKYATPFKQLGTLFQKARGGAVSEKGQRIYEGYAYPLEKTLRSEVAGTGFDLHKALAESLEGVSGSGMSEALRLARMAGEKPLTWDVGSEFGIKSSLPASFDEWMADIARRHGGINPLADDPRTMNLLRERMQDVMGVGGRYGEELKALGRAERSFGLGTEYDSPFQQYVTQQHVPPPTSQRQGESLIRTGARGAFDTRSATQTGRNPIFEIPGGSTKFDELAMDPFLSGPARTAANDLGAAEKIYQHIQPFESEAIRPQTTAELAETAKSIADVYKAMGPGHNPLADIFANMVKSIPEAEAAARVQSLEIAKLLHGLEPEYAAQKLPYFTRDLPNLFARRGQAYSMTLPAAKAIQEGISQYARPLAEIAPGADVVSVRDLLNRTGLGDEILQGTRQTAAAADHAIIPWDRMMIPGDLAKDMLTFSRGWTNPQELQPIVAALQNFTILHKNWITKPFPGKHTRDLLTDLYQTWREGALSTRSMSAMNALMHGGDLPAAPGMEHLSGEALRDAWVREMIQHNAAFSGSSRVANEPASAYLSSLRELPGKVDPRAAGERATDWVKGLWPGVEEGTTLNPFAVHGVAGQQTTRNTIIRQADKVSNYISDFTRGAHYIEKRLQGFAPEAAGASVNKAHINWSEFTPFESKLRQIIPFYAWSRGVLPPLLEDLALNPARLAASVRTANVGRQDDKFTPAYIGEGAAVPLPGAPEGQQRFLSQLGLPFEDELFGSLTSLMALEPKRALQKLGGMTNPLVQAPISLMTGKQLYSGRDIADLKPTGAGSAFALGSDEYANAVSQIIANTPASRFATTFDRLTDERKTALDKVLNIATGARMTDVDMEKAREIAVRNYIMGELRGKPAIQYFQNISAKPQEIANLSPEDAVLLKLYQQINARGRERAKAAEKK